MPTIAQVRADIANVLQTNLSGWRASAYVGDQVNPPHIKVGMPAFDPRLIFSQAKSSHTFRCTAYAPRATTEQSEAKLDALCELTGSGSFIATIQNGSLWSVTVDYAQVVNVSEVQVTTFGTDGTEYLARSFDVEVVW